MVSCNVLQVRKFARCCRVFQKRVCHNNRKQLVQLQSNGIVNFNMNQIVMKPNKLTKGGKRTGAGRKPAPYQTKTISFRVRVDLADDLRNSIKQFIKQYKKT